MKKKIFLADDSITIQKVVELTFSEGNYEVVCVGNGAAAMQALATSSPDIALLDVIMPDRNGYEICAQIKKHPESTWMPVLLLTGAFEPYDEKRAHEAGADGHMTKPFESRALTATVEKLLAEHPRPGTTARMSERATMEAAAPSASAAAPPPPATATMSAPMAGPTSPPMTVPKPEPRSEPTVRMKTEFVPQRPQPVPPPAPPPAPFPSRRDEAPPRHAPAAQPPHTAAASRATEPASPAPPANGGAATVSVPPEVIARAVREAVNGISEKIVREVAWEVIPDLAEAIIRRRIRELEEESER